MPSFTDLTVRSLPEGLHFDERTPGFAIRIGKKRKTWLVVKQPNRTKVRLGHYPALGLQEARRRALVALGTPLVARSAPLFLEALESFLAQDRWKVSTKKQMEWSLRRYFTWRKPLDKITHEDVAQVLDAIAAPSERAHAFSYIRMFFNWRIPRYLSTNPTHGYTVQASPPGSRVLTDDELKRVWIAADDTTPFGCIVRLCILTGQRRGELSNVQPSWVAEQSLTIPSTATKNKRQHSIPCGPIAIELLKKSSFSFNSWSKGLARLHKRSETSDWSLHDLRRTFATNLAALNVPIHVTEKLLNHVSGTTGGLVGVYQRHQYWDEQVAAIAAWEKRLQEIVGR